MHEVHREGLHLLTHRKHSKYLKKDLELKIIFFHILSVPTRSCPYTTDFSDYQTANPNQIGQNVISTDPLRPTFHASIWWYCVCKELCKQYQFNQ